MRLAERCGVSWWALEETGVSRHRTRRGRNVGGRGNRRAVRAGANGLPRRPVNAVEEDRGDEEIGNGADDGAPLARGLEGAVRGDLRWAGLTGRNTVDGALDAIGEALADTRQVPWGRGCRGRDVENRD